MRSMEEIFHEIVDALGEIKSAADVKTLLDKAGDLYGLRTVAYLGINIPQVTETAPYVAATYSEEWIARYKAMNYAKIDPVLRGGFASILPQDWQDFPVNSAKLRSFFGEAAEHGLGKRGLTFPIRGHMGDRALFTASADAGILEWAKLKKHYIRDLHMLAFLIHDTILRLEQVGPKTVHLTPREIECLKWIASGKTVTDIADILSLSERTVRFYLDEARRKLDTTNITHTVARAISLHLLSAPL